MRFRLTLTMLLAVSLFACTEALESDGQGMVTTGEALINAFPASSGPEQGMGAIGLERSGVFELRCSAAFLRNDWLLTRTSCVENVPGGARLVATNALNLNQLSTVNPNINTAQWVRVAEKSAISWNPDLSLVHLTQGVSVGRRGDPTLTSGFIRSFRNFPITSTSDVHCFGFSLVNNNLRLGEHLVRIPMPGAQFITVTLQGETSTPSDTGGACFVDGRLVGTMRHVDASHFEILDMSRSIDVPMNQEIGDAIAAQSIISRFSEWPLTLISQADSTRCLGARRNASGGFSVFADRCAPIWAQGFLNHVLFQGTNTIEVQMRHRETGLCLEGRSNVGLSLASCQLIAAQRFRTYYLSDGSVQVLNLGTGTCLVQSSNQMVLATCNNNLPGHRFFQGFGRR